MFKNPFSFKGSIGRGEYTISILIVVVNIFLLPYIIYECPDSTIELQNVFIGLGLLFFILLIWFKIAQSTKRCHDLGESGWWQLCPFYFLLLCFSKKPTNKK